MRILQMSLAASAIILFAMLLRLAALNRLPKRTFVALWLLAALRMLLPWEIPFRYSASAWMDRAAEPVLRSAMPAAPGAAQPMLAPATTNVVTQTASFPIWRVVWLTGLIACALALTLPHLRWRRVYARSLPARDADIASWLQSQKLLRCVRVRISDEIPSPLTYGLLRPVILLPKNLNPSSVKYVLAHETSHIRHLDALWKPVLAAALCAHWFNPLAWGMYLLANRDIELACDEAALRRLGEPARRDYAHTLLDLAARQSGLPSPLFSGFSRHTIEERIRAIMKTRKLTKIAALAAVLLVAFSALAFATTDAAAPETAASAEIRELMFDGYEDMSVREYRALVGALGVDYDALAHDPSIWNEQSYADSKLYDFLFYALEPLTDPNWEANGGWIRESGFGMANVDSGEEAGANLRVTCTVTDEDHLTVGRLRESLKSVFEGMESFDLLGATQEDLEAHARSLEERCSDGSTIAIQIDAELVGESSPYTDPDAEALLNTYAELGLEYEYFLGKLTMFYQGREVRGIRDSETGAVIANSTGPNGLSGGSILEVIYEDGQPSELRFTEE